jgi:hypothetical protein
MVHLKVFMTTHFSDFYLWLLRNTHGPLVGIWRPLRTTALEHWTTDKVQKPGHPGCYTPLSEPFRDYSQECLLSVLIENLDTFLCQIKERNIDFQNF